MLADGIEPAPKAGTWSYAEAFSRNRGLLSDQDQERLRASRVAIIGMGGVGGAHLVTMARLGIGSFHIADPDTFDVVNFNRQQGATLQNLGRNKAEAMADEVRQINPEVRLRVFAEPMSPANIDALLEGVEVVVDGIDFFAIEARRLLFREARRRGIWALTAGPIGFSAANLSFSPQGMSFDEYFDIHDAMDPADKLVAFIIGLAPKPTHLGYMDLSQVDPRTGRGPSSGLACHLCSGVVAAEVLKIILGRSPLHPAPWAFQFDAYRMQLRKVYLWLGNRHPWQRLKRRILRKRLEQMGWRL
ncbi:MAG TPA: ThiF family adenylyltransferase [Isosphaeraceae bacterium]|nr:ThiF family adenylyltransferase [Isosphaeraceae bacterium]